MPLLFEQGMDPAGGFAGLEDIGHRWEIDQVDSARVLPDFPGVGVAEDVGFDLLARAG